MSEITGFMKEKKQKNHYDNIVDLYNTWKKGKELIEQGDAADPNEVPFQLVQYLHEKHERNRL